MAALSRVVRARQDLVVEELDGELVVFDPLDDAVHHLDMTAAHVWSLIDGHRGLDQIVAELARRFDAELATVGRDVEAMLHLLERHGLIELDAPPAGSSRGR